VTEREAELQAVRLQTLEVHGKPIELAEYDPAWPELYGREAEKIRAALGDHVGAGPRGEADHRHRPRRCRLG
jgi:GrpB-like predicted nucleotidyltransferase (UPF0157 family)